MVDLCRFLSLRLFLVLGLLPLTCHSQNFVNPSLEDTIAITSTPAGWTAVPFTDAASQATGVAQSIPDVCGLTGPSTVTGINGNPVHGNSFVSGLQVAPNTSLYYHEGIQQTVSGFNTSIQYNLCFYQTVVKQSNCVDTSGSWAVYIDNTLLGISNVSSSNLAFNSNALIWDFQTITFTPTSTVHTFKFMPHDDEADAHLSFTHPLGALRMGIDSIYLEPLLPCADTLNIGMDTVLCIGDSLTLLDNNFSGYNYLWSTGDTTTSITINTPGTYWLQVDSSICSYYDTIIVSYPAGINLGNDTTICVDDSLLLDATASNATYLWNNLSTDSTLLINTAGTYYVEVTQNGCLNTDTITVNNFAVPAFDLGNDTTLCDGASLYIDATTPLANYVWDDASTNPDITISSADTVSLILTQNGCQYFDTIVVDYHPVLTQFLGNDTIFCQGGAITIGPNLSATDYLWSNASTDSATTFNLADTVWLQVTVNGCAYTDTLVLTNYPVVNLNLGNDTTICVDDSLLLDATTSNATYLWNNLSTDSTLLINTAGTYYVEVTQNGCLYTDTITVNNFAVPAFDLGNDTTLCDGASLYIDATTPLANYVWNDASTNPDITISSADTVSLILTQNGCQYFDTIVVDYTVPFQPNLISDTMLCPGQSFQIAFSNNYSFLWSNNSTDSSLVIDSPGLYWVEINDHGCIVIDSISVQFYPDPTVNLGNDTVICNATALSLDVFQQNATYVWHNNSSASNYTATNTELIWVTLTDSNNCQATDSIYVEKIDITLDLGPDLLLCDGDVVELNALQPFMANYQWQDNSYSSSYSITSAGQYFVTVSSSICLSSDTVNVDYINLIPDFTGDSAICYGSTIAFTNLSQISSNDYIQSYLWEFGDLQSSSAENPIHLYNAAGQYDVSLTITSSFGCSARITANNYVQVYTVPEASFIYQTENTDAIEPLIYFESTSPNSDNWFWKINNVPVAATENFTYDFDAFSSGYQYVELIVTNDFGCSDTVTQYIKIDEATILYVPNAFTPFNAGNLNNTFKPIFTSGFEKQSYRFMIFNRWGEVIFESMDPEVGWDGTYGNKLCEMGVYVWYIEYMDDQSSETKTVNGTVTLIR